MAELVVRPVREDEWEAVREVRLHALRSEPGLFCSRYESEAARDEDAWRALVAHDGDDRCVFGVFDGEALVGMTAVVADRDDERGETAMFAMSFVSPSYRGRGIARLMYEARLAWVRARPRFSRVRVSHRRSNEPSRRAMLRHGFAETGHQVRVWPDGGAEDEVMYELRLRPPK